jgi:hypothetical protein
MAAPLCQAFSKLFSISRTKPLTTGASPGLRLEFNPYFSFTPCLYYIVTSPEASTIPGDVTQPFPSQSRIKVSGQQDRTLVSTLNLIDIQWNQIPSETAATLGR